MLEAKDPCKVIALGASIAIFELDVLHTPRKEFADRQLSCLRLFPLFSPHERNIFESITFFISACVCSFVCLLLIRAVHFKTYNIDSQFKTNSKILVLH